VDWVIILFFVRRKSIYYWRRYARKICCSRKRDHSYSEHCRFSLWEWGFHLENFLPFVVSAAENYVIQWNFV